MKKADHKRCILRDLAVILGKDDDLMRDEIDPCGRDAGSWRAAKDELIAEFERRSATSLPEKMDLTPEPCECHGDPYCEDDK